MKRGTQEEKFEGLTLARGAKNVLEVVNKQSTLVTLEEVATKGVAIPERAPAAGHVRAGCDQPPRHSPR